MKIKLKIFAGVLAVIILLTFIAVASGTLKFSTRTTPPQSNTSLTPKKSDLTDELQARSRQENHQSQEPAPFSFTGLGGITISGLAPRGWDSLPEKPAGLDHVITAFAADLTASGQFRANVIFATGPIPIAGAKIQTIEDALTIYEQTYTRVLGQEFPNATFGKQYRTTVNGVPAYVVTLRRGNEDGNPVYQEQYTYFIDAKTQLQVTATVLDSATFQHRSSLDELFSSVKIDAT